MDSGASTPDRDLRSPASEQQALTDSLEHLSISPSHLSMAGNSNSHLSNSPTHLSTESSPPPTTSSLSSLHPVLCMLLQTPTQDSLIVTTRRQRELAQSRLRMGLSCKHMNR